LTAIPSGRRTLGEQVAHRTRLTAEEVAEERVNVSEASLAGGLEEPELEPGHRFRGALRDLPGHPLVVVYDDAPDVAAGELGGDSRDFRRTSRRRPR
jgi:hypothetical protein